MSQTDNHIRLLDRSGDLNEVAGSQSMLSQELIYHRHDSDDDSGDEEATNTSTAACLLEDLGLPNGWVCCPRQRTKTQNTPRMRQS
eukprot:jgi/Psemu1/312253/fgenesh1_kg.904_\